jgi:DNA invertase Pin-like site-specific DNA recombinase
MATGKFVAYFRVSTQKQGLSGLGMDAQKAAVQGYLNGGSWEVIGECIEIESGKRADRPELLKALALCRIHGAKLIIGKLDRLSRNVRFLANLMAAGVQFVACDMPEADITQLQLMMVFAEHETRVVSARTKAALQAAKANGKVLGCRNTRIASEAHKGAAVSAMVRTEQAKRRAEDIMTVIRDVQAQGAVSLRQIAAKLNRLGVRTSRGGEWSAVQVQRVLAADQ